jgi:hypothetical protein
MEKNSKAPQGKKAYTAQEAEAMGFSIEEPKRLRSFKSSPYYRCSNS